MLQDETSSLRGETIMRTCYEVRDQGRAIGWVVSADGQPQAGPGSATVLLTRHPAVKSHY